MKAGQSHFTPLQFTNMNKPSNINTILEAQFSHIKQLQEERRTDKAIAECNNARGSGAGSCPE